MTDLDRLLAAGNALADAVHNFNALNDWDDERRNHAGDVMHDALDAWRALAREVRKEKGDDA